MEYAASVISSTTTINISTASILSGYSDIGSIALVVSNAIRLQYILPDINTITSVDCGTNCIFALSAEINTNTSVNCIMTKVITATETINALSQFNVLNIKRYNTVKAHLSSLSDFKCYYYDGDIRSALSKMLPEIVSSTETFINLQNIQGNKLTELYAKINDMFNQFFVNTATHGLDDWEEFIGITTDANYTTAERIEKIKSRMILNYQTIPTSQFDKIMDTYYQCNVTEDFNNSSVNITVLGIRGIPPKINDMIKDAEDLLPCHLAYNFIYTYLTWYEIEATDIKWEKVDTYIWNGLETAFLI